MIELELIRILLQSIGALAVSVGAIVAFAYWLFRLFSDKWLTAKFAERLEDYKHSQQKELENIRFEINKLMDRTVKLHQREFDVLPEAWALLVEAHGVTIAVISPLQQYPDVGRMNEAQLNEFLADSPFENWQIEELKAADDKNKYYQRALNWQKILKAQEATREFHVYRLKHGIFMLPAIHEKFEQMDDLIFKAIFERQLQLEQELYIGENADRKKLDVEGAGVMKELETDIRDRLWS